MKAQVKAVMATQVPPDDDDESLHEFFLYWYFFTEDPQEREDPRRTRPAVWVRFGEVSHLKAIQFHYPDARLGPSSSYTEALIFTETWDTAKQLAENVSALLIQEQEETIGEIIEEDTLEDI